MGAIQSTQPIKIDHLIKEKAAQQPKEKQHIAQRLPFPSMTGEKKKVPRARQRLPPWEYSVDTPPLAMVTGGTTDLFAGEPPFGEPSACLMTTYARCHGYSMMVERDLGRWSAGRVPAWGKIILLEVLLRSHATLPILVWVDLDIVLVDVMLPLLQQLLQVPNCTAGLVGDAKAGSKQYAWAPFLKHSKAANSSFWLGRDLNDEYTLNVNSGLFAIRNTQLAKRFLRCKRSDFPLTLHQFSICSIVRLYYFYEYALLACVW